MKPNLVFLTGILINGHYNLTQISEESFFQLIESSILSRAGSETTNIVDIYQRRRSHDRYQLLKTAPLRNLPDALTALSDLTFVPIVKGLYYQGYVYTFQEDDRTQPDNWKLLMCVDLATENLTDRLKEDYLPQVDQLITYLTGIQVSQQRDEKLVMLLDKLEMLLDKL